MALHASQQQWHAVINPVDSDAPAGGLVTSQDPEESLLRDCSGLQVHSINKQHCL